MEAARAATEQAQQAAEYEQAQEDAINAKADRQGAFPPQKKQNERRILPLAFETCYQLSFEKV